MRIDEDGLRVGITDDAHAGLSLESRQFRLEFRAEVRALQAVNGANELAIVVRGHTATLRAQVRVIVRAVKQVGDALGFRYSSKKTTHIVVFRLDHKNTEFSLKRKNIGKKSCEIKKSYLLLLSINDLTFNIRNLS
jgi:hypothetical protein